MKRKTVFVVLISILLAIIISSALVYYFYWSNGSKSSSAENLQKPSQIYGLVIDAGSTGTRINGYEFERNGTEYVLKDAIFRQKKPGLSSLSPGQANTQIKDLLNYAQRFIPAEFHNQTSLKLKATAGFRLLDPERSQWILDAVRNAFQSSKFAKTENSVEIIDGNIEGIYSWISINYLRNLLTSKNKVTALDLGGGSTQITYEISDKVPEDLKNFTHEVKIFGSRTELYVKSYLGLGLMALRKAVITRDVDENERKIESDCINSDFEEFEWEYYGSIFKISPKSTDNSTFDDCVIIIRKIVSELMKPKIPNIDNHTIDAFSFFYDRSVDAQLIESNDEGTDVEVEKFRQKAIEHCEEKIGDDPWLCLDLTYISVLLQDGYGLRDHKKIRLFTKINGREANWALGSFLLDSITKYKNT